MQAELLPDFLRLYHSLYPARASLVELLRQFDDNPRRVFAADRSALAAAGLPDHRINRIRQCRQARIDADLEWLQAGANHLVCYLDDRYPELLRQIPDFPVLLYATGQVERLREPQIAIVGSRNCTPGGAQNAFDFAMQCAASGLAITSGLALGIDAAAHRGALAAGGATVAVTGTGLDRVYPQRHHKLASSIVEQGLMVSEFPLGSAARAAHFPQRNRIISGLAMATLVVEAAQRSGSLITARLAAEQGREVFALPGSIHNPLSRGCHQLIRDGASLVETTADIASELGSLFQFARQQRSSDAGNDKCNLDEAQQALLESIGYDPVSCDMIAQRSGLTIDKLSSMLVTLELNDLIQSAPGGCFVRI